MSRPAPPPRRVRLPILLPVLLAVLLTGCVRRIHDAPGLSPGSAMAVSADMRLPVFEVGDYEVRPFRITVGETNPRRYQFSVLEHGIHLFDYFVERLPDGGWALMEHRNDGISVARESWTSEPSYAAARAAVVNLLDGASPADG